MPAGHGDAASLHALLTRRALGLLPGESPAWRSGAAELRRPLPPPCSKVTARPVRHSIPSLHTGVDGLFERYNIVFANRELWKAARNAWSPFFSQARPVGGPQRHACVMEWMPKPCSGLPAGLLTCPRQGPRLTLQVRTAFPWLLTKRTACRGKQGQACHLKYPQTQHN